MRLHLLLLLSALLWGSTTAKASVTIFLNPATGVITPDHFLRHTISSDHQSGNFLLRVTVNDNSSPVAIITSELNPFTGGIQIVQLTPSDVQRGVYQAEGWKSYLLGASLLPGGKITYCVEILDPKTGVPFAKQCTAIPEITCKLLTNITPYDKVEVVTSHIPFSWSMVTDGFHDPGQVKYKLLAFEVAEGQSKYQAIQSSNPVLSTETQTQFYTASGFAMGIEKGGHYAWYVEAWNTQEMICRSEPFEFTIPDSSPIVKINQGILSTGNQAVQTVVAIGSLNVVLEQRSPGSLHSIQIFDEEGALIKSFDTFEDYQEGDNFYSLDLRYVAGIRHARRYKAVIHLSGGSTKEILFKYVDPRKNIR